jgi:16S rRNA (guanine966-N2)-methyltransferase
VREALFSMLAGLLPGARFLDLYAGSGAVGIEAWSRGAESVCCVEGNRRVHRVLKENMEQLCPERAEAVLCEAVPFLEKRVAPGAFHIIFADPPYGRSRRGTEPEAGRPGGKRRPNLPAEEDGVGDVLDALTASNALAPGGVFVMEQAFESPVTSYAGWTLLKDRSYGESRLLVFERLKVGAGGAGMSAEAGQ